MLIAIMGDTFDKVTENKEYNATVTKIQFITQYDYALDHNKKNMERRAFEEETSIERLWFVAMAKAWYYSALDNLYKNSSSDSKDSDFKFFFQISLDGFDDQESTE